MMEIVEFLSKDKPYNAWECQECGTVTPIKKGLPAPICEYCRRKKEGIYQKICYDCIHYLRESISRAKCLSFDDYITDMGSAQWCKSFKKKG